MFVSTQAMQMHVLVKHTDGGQERKVATKIVYEYRPKAKPVEVVEETKE